MLLEAALLRKPQALLHLLLSLCIARIEPRHPQGIVRVDLTPHRRQAVRPARWRCSPIPGHRLSPQPASQTLPGSRMPMPAHCQVVGFAADAPPPPHNGGPPFPAPHTSRRARTSVDCGQSAGVCRAFARLPARLLPPVLPPAFARSGDTHAPAPQVAQRAPRLPARPRNAGRSDTARPPRDAPPGLRPA